MTLETIVKARQEANEIFGPSRDPKIEGFNRLFTALVKGVQGGKIDVSQIEDTIAFVAQDDHELAQFYYLNISKKFGLESAQTPPSSFAQSDKAQWSLRPA